METMTKAEAVKIVERMTKHEIQQGVVVVLRAEVKRLRAKLDQIRSAQPAFEHALDAYLESRGDSPVNYGLAANVRNAAKKLKERVG